MKPLRKNFRLKSLILSSFLVVILFTYNNCAKLSLKSGDYENSLSISFNEDITVNEYKLKFPEYELRFKGAKLDNKVYSISDLTVYPHTDIYKEVVFFEKGRESTFPLKVNSLTPNRDASLLRLKNKDSKIKVFLR